VVVLSAVFPNVSGYVLAGGLSSRLGRDKRRIVVGGISLLERAVGRLASLLGEEPVVVGNNIEALPFRPRRCLPDAASGCGPIGGLVAALDHCPTTWCLVVATDMPHLRADDLRPLLDARDASLDVLTLTKGRNPEPLAAVYNKRTNSFWRSRLLEGEYSLMSGIENLEKRMIAVGAESKALTNINTPDDLANLENE
jgi:molybdopterin-guanine dinucleotide biosynthesis protein A